ncbi:MAG: MJ0042-type zinc finger domain-containing protein [Planctomycetaceae bacterium]
MITVNCPDCSKSYKVSPSLIGKKVKCKACDTTFPIVDATESQLDTEDYETSSPKTGSPKKPAKRAEKKSASFDEDEFAGLNSVSSEGEAIDELPELPAKRKRKTSSSDEDDAEERPRKKRKARSQSSGFSFGGPLSAVLAACVSGGAGAIIWCVIVIVTHYEIGWIAWGVGALVGASVRFAAKEIEESTAGVIAAIGSAVSIMAGKLLLAVLIVQFVPVEEIDAELGKMTNAGRLIHLFASNFGIIDFIFFFLAVGTAYKIGSSYSDE